MRNLFFVWLTVISCLKKGRFWLFFKTALIAFFFYSCTHGLYNVFFPTGGRGERRGEEREVGPNAQIASKKADLDHQKHPCTHPHEIIPCFHLPNHLQNQPKKRGGSSSLLPPPLHDEIILHFGHPNHVLFCDNQVSVFNEYHDLNMTKSWLDE